MKNNLSDEELKKVAGGCLYEKEDDVRFMYNVGDRVRFTDENFTPYEGTITSRDVESRPGGQGAIAYGDGNPEIVTLATMYYPIYHIQVAGVSQALKCPELRVIGLC